jgi:hypothetical protein
MPNARQMPTATPNARRLASPLALICAAGVTIAGIWPGAMAMAQPTTAPTPVPTPDPSAPPAPPQILPGTIVIKPAPPADAAAPAVQAPPAKPDERTEKLLTDIEAADKGLSGLSSTVQYVKRFPEIQGGGTHVWRGSVHYREAAKGKRQFAVMFDTMIVDDKKRDDKQEYVFDGRWLITRNPVEKQFNRIELINDAGGKDPLKIGEGPVPLPIGQRKDDMIARFTLTSPQDPLDGIGTGKELDSLRSLLKNTRQLRLKPTAGSAEARNFREISLWYRKGDNLPVFAQTSNTDDSKAEVLLVDIKTNAAAALGDAMFDTTAPAGWQGEERPRR